MAAAMIDIPVVLVLGAGASHPYGFPLGRDLVDEAITNSSGLKPILAEIHDALPRRLEAFLRALDTARPTSIDAFLEARHPQFEYEGKAVIAYHLMKKEDEKKLDTVPRDEDWYQHFLYEMLHINDYNNIGFSRISILTYNYDRSLEYFVFKRLRGLGHSEEACRKAVEALYIRHLHGQIGYLPEIDGKGRRYEPRVDAARLKLAIDGIRVIHEPVVENDPIFFEPYIWLRQAKNVIFLGFGYLDKNVERLNLQENRMTNTSYWGTGVGVPPAVAKRLVRLFPKNESGEGPTHITIDTETGSVKDYLLNHPYLFSD